MESIEPYTMGINDKKWITKTKMHQNTMKMQFTETKTTYFRWNIIESTNESTYIPIQTQEVKQAGKQNLDKR